MKKTFAVIAGIALILVIVSIALNAVTYANAQKEHVWLMETLLPGGSDFKKLAYAGEDDTIRSVHQAEAGFVIETVTGGYADDIVMYIGVDNSGKVTGLVVYEAHETLGLGSRILYDDTFLAQFLNQSGSFSIGSAEADAASGATVEWQPSDSDIWVDGISGATVSSKAVARCVNTAIAYVTGADINASATP